MYWTGQEETCAVRRECLDRTVTSCLLFSRRESKQSTEGYSNIAWRPRWGIFYKPQEFSQFYWTQRYNPSKDLIITSNPHISLDAFGSICFWGFPWLWWASYAWRVLVRYVCAVLAIVDFGEEQQGQTVSLTAQSQRRINRGQSKGLICAVGNIASLAEVGVFQCFLFRAPAPVHFEWRVTLLFPNGPVSNLYRLFGIPLHDKFAHFN